MEGGSSVNHNRKELNLHLGCFDQILEGWINTDITPHLFISCVPGCRFIFFKLGILSEERYKQHQTGIFRKVHYLNVKKRFPYPTESVDYVYISHLINNLDPPDGTFCLREVYRVLKRGGRTRIVVPDLDKFIENYDRQHSELFLDKIFEAKEKWNKNRQHWHYNEISLSRLLREVGFGKVCRCSFRQGRVPDVDKIEIRPDSLFMEAVK